MKSRLVSIITPCFNSEKTIERTIESILNQTYTNIEFILIDGKSSDKTMDVIKSYENKFFEKEIIFKYVSESDTGIYDAMNKGIDIAEGEWLYFLGSDDYFFDSDTIEKINLPNYEEESIVFGKIQYLNNTIFKSNFSRKLLINNVLHHQSAFYRHSNFINFRYERKLKLISDYELNLINYIRKRKTKFIDIIIAKCSEYGASQQNFKLSVKETNFIKKRNLNLFVYSIFWFLFLIKVLTHLILRKIKNDI